ncbi:ABC transporter permease [Chryseolinea soli]|uniref:ABC transporter permease n=1 Tax=Chryseolinea soli TaxID=2321403 RepID=A0A385STN7_9BACT|nr:ABC transporter permease [Chryseolinea soli]AYB33050.1 ABC transporter permease [Chryseolinea soli]
MLLNYFVISFRNLLRHKLFSFINIGGLALGLAATWIIGLYVGHELSYDRYHEHSNRIFRIAQHAQWDGGEFNGATTPPPYGAALKADFPEVAEFVRIDAEGGGTFTYNNKEFKVGDVLLVDKTFFQIFSGTFLYGDKATALDQPQSMIITRALAIKIFGNESAALGKTMQAGNEPVVISGVIDDVPSNSHFSFSGLRPLPNNLEGLWTNAYLYTYVLLHRGEDATRVQQKLPGFFDRHMAASMPPGMQYRAEMQPLTAIHLHSNLSFELGANSPARYIYILCAIAALILIIASINYMNLSTARASLRLRETGMRKVMGSTRTQVMALFLSESVLVTIIASSLAVVLMTFIVPLLQSFAPIAADIWQFGTAPTIAALLVFSVFAGLLSGVYPALFMSGFRVVPSLKGLAGDLNSTILFRQSLVVFQFVVTIAMIAASVVIYQQLRFVSRKDLGFNKDQVITFHLDNPATRLQTDALRTQLLQNPLIEEATTAGNPIGNNNIGGRQYTIERQGKMEDRQRVANYFTIDDTFVLTLQIAVTAGRNLSAAIPSDKTDAVLVNQTLADDAAWDDAVGKKIQMGTDSAGRPILLTVVGVLKDFNIYSLQHKVEPLILQLPQDEMDKDNVYVRMSKTDLPAAIAYAESVFRKFNPAGAFEYNFLDDNFGRQYQAERRQANLLLSFTILAVSIACLGLFGLMTFAAERRRKEIGIRKVLGSSVGNIVFILAKDLLILVVVAAIIAIPIAWTAANAWLSDFAYRIEISWLVFAFAGCVAVVIAFATVCFQAINSANENPVKSLRAE